MSDLAAESSVICLFELEDLYAAATWPTTGCGPSTSTPCSSPRWLSATSSSAG